MVDAQVHTVIDNGTFYMILLLLGIGGAVVNMITTKGATLLNIDTIVISPDSVDIYNPKVVRSNQGMMFHTNIIITDTEKLIKELKEKDYKIIGTKVTNGKDVKEASIYSHFALIIGNEGKGISDNIEKLCDEFLYIKMNDKCESLNASVAASILLYEINNK